MKSHIHKYSRTKLGETYYVYRCVLINCTHYLHPQFVVGKLSLCFKCGEPFEMTKKSLLKKPICKNCKPKRVETEKKSLIDKIMGDLALKTGD